MDQDHAGIAGLLGISRPSGTGQARLTLVAARCAEGINRPGAGYRVIHTLSGLHLGIVARRDDEPGWCYICPREGCEPSDFSHPDKHSAAIALSAHMLDHGLALVRARLAASDTTPPWPPVQLSAATALLAKAEAEDAQKDAADAAARQARAEQIKRAQQ
jgi:hypothetical protein